MIGVVLAVAGIYLFRRFLRALRQEFPKIDDDRLKLTEIFGEECDWASIALATVGFVVPECITTNHFLAAACAGIGIAATLVAYGIQILLRPVHALIDVIGQSDRGKLLLQQYHKSEAKLADFVAEFFLRALGDGHRYASAIVSGEPPLKVLDEALTRSLVARLLETLGTGSRVHALLMPSASGRLSAFGSALAESQPDLIMRSVAINKCYAFFDASYYPSKALARPEASRKPWIGNLGSLVESSALLMADQPLSEGKDCSVSVGRRADWLNNFDLGRRPTPLEMPGVDPFKLHKRETPLTEILWLQRTAQNSALIVAQRDFSDHFTICFVWEDAGGSAKHIAEFFDRLTNKCAEPWKPDLPQFECAFSNAVAIRDSQPGANIWATEVVPKLADLDSWFSWWFRPSVGFPAASTNLEPDALAAARENIGRALVWEYSKENNDFKNLQMRRVFLLPRYSKFSKKARRKLAVDLIAAMTINAVFNIEARAALKEVLSKEQIGLVDCMLRWQQKAGTTASALADNTRVYYCGIPDGKSKFKLAGDTELVQAYAQLWFAGTTIADTAADLLAGFTQSERSAFVSDVAKRIEDALTTIESEERWKEHEKTRLVWRQGQAQYEISNLVTGRHEDRHLDNVTETRVLWERALLESLLSAGDATSGTGSMDDTASWIEYYRRQPGLPLTYPWPAPFLTRLIEAAKLPRTIDDRVCLEIGAGSGIRNFPVLREIARDIILLDVSEESLEAGRVINPAARRIVADASNIPLPSGGVDIVIASDLFMHLRDWGPQLSEVRRVLRDGGILFFNWLGLEDCQRTRVTEAPDGLVLPAGVPVVFRDGAFAEKAAAEAGFSVLALARDWREDPPHPEFFPEPHTHDEWSMALRK